MGKPKKAQSVGGIAQKAEKLGKQALFIGFLGADFVCPVCSKRTKKAMISEYQNKRFCSEDCIRLSLSHVSEAS